MVERCPSADELDSNPLATHLRPASRSCTVGAAVHQALRKHDGVHRTRTGAAGRGEVHAAMPR
jgi:hypothetical protein